MYTTHFLSDGTRGVVPRSTTAEVFAMVSVTGFVKMTVKVSVNVFEKALAQVRSARCGTWYAGSLSRMLMMELAGTHDFIISPAECIIMNERVIMHKGRHSEMFGCGSEPKCFRAGEGR